MKERDSELKRTANALAYEWVIADLPTTSVVYTDYITTITRLLLATNDTFRAINSFIAVINQAGRLGRSSEWVVDELTFETYAEVVGDRRQAMNLSIASLGSGSDASLDQYNERLDRFNQRLT